MAMHFVRISDDTRRAYERFFFEKICSMKIASRQDFTIPLPQVEGLYFTSVQDTVERLTDLSGRLSTFQWRNCIFAPISKSARSRDIYLKIFGLLKSRTPSLFVRSYVYLIFLKLESSETPSFDFGEAIHPTVVRPRYDDYQIYYWNTKYEVKPGRKKNLFGDAGNESAQNRAKNDDSLEVHDAIEIEASPEKLFIVRNPAFELQRIQDANSDIIDAFKAFNNTLPLVEQTKNYLDLISQQIDDNDNARILAEGPARSGKTVLAMSLLAKYPKSKLLLMNWYFYDALIDAFKIWAELSKDEIEQLFSMPQSTEKLVASKRRKLNQFQALQSDTRVIDVALRALEVSANPRNKLPRWTGYTNGLPAPKDAKVDEWRAKPIEQSSVGDLVPVIKGRGADIVMQIVEVVEKHDDGSASVAPLRVV
jgi:hypothetical protein